MLPKRLRLTRHDFPDARGLKRFQSRHFSLSYGEREASGGTAVVISKKVSPSSVARHLLKRRVISVLRPYVTDSRIFLIHARPGAAELPSAELTRELISLLGSILPEPK
jgi:ribonuclease P protein component